MSLKKQIRQSKEPPKGVLVPLVEQFMTASAVQIETPEDVKFLHDLATRMMMREGSRREEGLGFYSPSSLGERCLRKAYLGRHATRNPHAPSPYGMSAHYYFLTGNFIHMKWQFVLYKMEKWIANSAIFRTYGHEIPVASKRGDHRGTIDQIVFIYEEPYVLDYKGLNVFSARKVELGNIPVNYRIQVADYLVLWNSQKQAPFRIEKGLLVVEDKGGGEKFLHESLITLAEDGERARRRLVKLREHEKRNQMPTPLCKSLKDKTFQGCQFRTICWDEVEAAGKLKTAKIRDGLEKVPPDNTQERVLKALKARK